MRRGLVVLAGLAAVVSLAVAWPGGAVGARAGRAGSAVYPTRYSLVHGCYYARIGGKRLGPFRMQAAALGQYLLYGRHADFLGPSLTQVGTPSRSTIWVVAAGARRLRNLASRRRVSVTFSPGTGCAVYPEAQVGATGAPLPAASLASSVFGTAEGHAHITAMEFFGGDWHCGTPWSPYGAPYALPASCAKYQQGTNGAWEKAVDYGGGSSPGPMRGWPVFQGWPTPTTLAEEGDYWTGLERAWLAGLRLVVSNNVDNEQLCDQMTVRSHDCLDMTSVKLQAHDLYALQNYIDAQSGGPGRGFFRIVLNPFQARQVINQGKMAVIMGIEVSKIFECGEYNHVPSCDRHKVDQGLALVHRLGVRTFFPVHEFDNAFGGSKGISGDTGIIINAGQRKEDGYFFTLRPCKAQDQDAQEVALDPTGATAKLLNGPFADLLGGNPAPVYGPGPQCNVQGLTSLGAYLINKMIRQHVVIQLDHMDSKTAAQSLAIATAHHYAGVVSAHCCNSPQLFSGVYATGGTIDAPKDQPAAFLTLWRQDKADWQAAHNRGDTFGFGFGSDLNGLSAQTGPEALHYPFKSYDGRVTFRREVWGQRTFDLNTDGVANYGMFADWLGALDKTNGPAFAADMYRGAEAYLDMWERAFGVPVQHCVTRGALLRAARRGRSFASVLYSLGQPQSRTGSSYSYCAGGWTGIVRFDRAGRTTGAVTLIR